MHPWPGMVTAPQTDREACSGAWRPDLEAFWHKPAMRTSGGWRSRASLLRRELLVWKYASMTTVAVNCAFPGRVLDHLPTCALIERHHGRLGAYLRWTPDQPDADADRSNRADDTQTNEQEQ
jgi:hypothetical protein